MNQLPLNRLAQVNFSLLIQLARQPATSALLVSDLRKNLTSLVKIPAQMLKCANFLIPDRSIAALNTQDITLRKLVDWYFAPHGGKACFQKFEQTSGKKPIQITGQEPDRDKIEKERAVNSLNYALKIVDRDTNSVRVAEQYYLKAKKRHWEMAKDHDMEPDQVSEQYRKLITEANTLAEKHDALGLATLFFLKNRCAVEHEGYDTSGFSHHALMSDDEIKGASVTKSTTPSMV